MSTNGRIWRKISTTATSVRNNIVPGSLAAAAEPHKLCPSFLWESLKMIQPNSRSRPPLRQTTSCLKLPVQDNGQKQPKMLASKRETIFPVAPRWLPRIESRSDWAARAKCLPHSASSALIGHFITFLASHWPIVWVDVTALWDHLSLEIDHITHNSDLWDSPEYTNCF